MEYETRRFARAAAWHVARHRRNRTGVWSGFKALCTLILFIGLLSALLHAL